MDKVFDAVNDFNKTSYDIYDIDVTDDREYEPASRTWRDSDGVIHIDVEDGLGENVAWTINKDGMEKVYDLMEMPF